MIILDNVSYTASKRAGGFEVLSAVSMSLPADSRVVLVGSSEVEKREVMQLFAGVVSPQRGLISRKVKVAFPTGLLTAFDQQLSFRHNLEYIARLYDVRPAHIIRFYEGTLQMGEWMDPPMAKLPKDVRMLLSSIVPLSLPFDFYVVHSIIKSSSERLNEVANAIFETRVRTNGMILGTRDWRFAARYCQAALLIKDKKLIMPDDIKKAFWLAKLGRSRVEEPEPDEDPNAAEQPPE
jgi:ABC-type polysaccharide/polyol phosphate transport system ATPase subunit